MCAPHLGVLFGPQIEGWVATLSLAPALLNTRPEAIGVGHAWLGSEASLAPAGSAAPVPVLPGLDWHELSLPVIHPDRHPGLLLQIWAGVPIQYPDVYAPLALLLFCLQANCPWYRDLLAVAWDGRTASRFATPLLKCGVSLLVVELRRTMLECLPGTDSAGSFAFPSLRAVTEVADRMYGLRHERSWHLLHSLGSLLTVTEALFEALPLPHMQFFALHTGDRLCPPPPAVRGTRGGCRLTVRASNTLQSSLRACLLDTVVHSGTVNVPVSMVVVALPLLVITVDHTDADGTVNHQCITAELSLTLGEIFPGCWYAESAEEAEAFMTRVVDYLPDVYGPDGVCRHEGWYTLRAVLGEKEHSSGVHRPFALLPELRQSRQGAVDRWLLVQFGGATFPELFETQGKAECALGMPAGNCAVASFMSGSRTLLLLLPQRPLRPPMTC